MRGWHAWMLRGLRVVSWMLFVGFCMLCAAAAGLGAGRFAQADPHMSTRVIAGTLLSLALTLPMIATASPMVARGEVAAAVTGQIGLVLLNLCCLLPITIAASAVREWARPWPGVGRHFGLEVGEWSRHLHWPVLRDAALPVVVWRIDFVWVLALSLLLLPMGLGLVPLNRRVAGLLIFGYSVYLLAAMLSGVLG